MPRYRYAVTALLVFCPILTHGAVSISEVAWMGGTESPNHEWIELYNDGEEVALEGWLLDDGANLSIALTGTVPANSYVILERNRSTGAYLVDPPFLIYTGALVNTGAKLRLTDASGNVVDVTPDSLDIEGWEIGGDNATKATAQKTSAGWGTGTPTPGRANVHTEAPDEGQPTGTTGGSNNSEGSGSTPSAKKPSAVSEPTVPGQLALRLVLSSPETVGKPLSFTVTPSGPGPTILNSLSYAWNFGDGSPVATSGVKATHTYQYPGTYIVTVTAQFRKQSAAARHAITILPATFSLTRSPLGNVQINNDANYDVDVSGYRVIGSETLTMPSGTIMSARGTITMSHDQMSLSPAGEVKLLDRQGRIMAFYPSIMNDEESEDTSTVSLASVERLPATAQNLTKLVPENLREETFVSTTTNATLVAAAGLTTTPNPLPGIPNTSPLSPRWPYAAFGILLAGTVGWLLVRPPLTAPKSVPPTPHSGIFSP